MIKKHKKKYYILFVISATMILSFIPIDIDFSSNPNFGVVTIDEPITSSRDIVKQLSEFNTDDNIDTFLDGINSN